jgi:hypothetical protein
MTTIIVLVSACGSKPSGTYTATGILGLERTITFEDDTVEIQSAIGIKKVYKYEIRDNGEEIILTDIVSEKSVISSYKFIKDPPCVVIDDIAYYKQDSKE